MLFNSSIFLLIYLPLVLLGFFILATLKRHRLVALWMTGASLFFYGWWNPIYVPLLLASIVFNYALGGYLVRRRNTVLLATGIAANVLLLGYFKYAGFLVQVADQAAGLDWTIPNIVLPLAISFFTFQQIAYLVDAHDGDVVEHDFLNYLLFITFFPHLIAGPITHHREMIPQFTNPGTFRPKLEYLAVGLTLFLIGLFKKVGIADTMGTYARPVYESAAQGVPLTFLESWGGAVSYALQVYFDFSGYTDMACGLALMFGIVLPPNFNSPYKARSIIEFWSRWHMTLTRFITAYIYNPIVVNMTRSRVRRGLSVPRRGVVPPDAFLALVAFPTIFAMFVVGIWHGAGWQFAIFGLIHGLLLTVNNGWRLIKARWGFPVNNTHPVAIAGSVLLTFTCVVVALVFFRADDTPAALNLLTGMLGGHGLVLPSAVGGLPGMSALADLFDLRFGELLNFGIIQVLWIVVLLTAVWTLPNSQQWLRNYRAVLAAQLRPSWLQTAFPALVWRPASLVGFAMGSLGLLVVVRAISAAPTEFLYFQF